MAGAIMAGRFRKVSNIGRGTFGEAWLVTSTCSGRRYVIKEVRVDQMSDEELEQARTEATILARCKHSSIIRYKEYFMLENPATMCLVMEYADGGDLSLRVKETRKRGELMDEEDILYWFVQVVFAVQYLHVNNILHRDLKTQNVFLTKTNLVKVGDFGIARFLRDKQDLAMTAIGTPYYLSPEICQRRPYNHKSDMWAVGCILYELCALNHPFQAKYFDDLIINILRGSYKPLPRKFSSLVQDLTRVMLRTNPDRRPAADALLMLPALKPYVENYLVKHEELLAHRLSTKQSQNGKEEEHNVQALKKDGIFKDVLRISTLKKSPRQARGSIDLGQIQPRKQGFESNSQGSPVSKGERQCNALGVGLGHRPRCVSDSALERNATPTTPVVTTRGTTALKGQGSSGDFKTPPRILRRKKKRRADTPMPRTARKSLCGRQEEEEEGERDGKPQPQEDQEMGKRQWEDGQRGKQKQQAEKKQQQLHEREGKQQDEQQWQIQQREEEQRRKQRQRGKQQQQEEERGRKRQPEVEQQREYQQHEEEQQRKVKQREQREQNWSPEPMFLQDTLSGSGSSGEELEGVRRRNTVVSFSGTYIIPRSVAWSSGSDNDSQV
ncbi:serine/threonine-protein kinase Nek11-like isoform X2 [Panulirus ornatus]|uniref:serine/threonine-protein kinase Nek11-like isoform X2 n=1 Tax=Panulirus ornatus TaxID=150431 RepID=UPI003A87F181